MYPLSHTLERPRETLTLSLANGSAQRVRERARGHGGPRPGACRPEGTPGGARRAWLLGKRYCARARVGRESAGIRRSRRASAHRRVLGLLRGQMLLPVVRADAATHLWSRVDFLTIRECPPGTEAPLPKARAAVRLRALAAGWLSSKAWTIRYERAKASESPRVAKSACKMWFRLQSASNSPKTHVFGTMRSVSRRPITVAVFRRAVRHHRTPARRSTPSPTPRRCPAVAESASAENRRMATAA